MAEAVRDTTRSGTSNYLPRILLIFRGTDAQWAALRLEVSSLGGHEPLFITSTTGLDIKGLVSYMVLAKARELTTSPLREALGLRGFSIDPSAHITAPDNAWLDEESGDDGLDDEVEEPQRRAGQGNARRPRRSAISRPVSARQPRPRQVTGSDLELQFGIWTEEEYPRQLAQLSNPPRSQNALYSMYKGYVQDPQAGSDVHIYIIDGPAYPDHEVSHILLLPS